MGQSKARTGWDHQVETSEEPLWEPLGFKSTSIMNRVDAMQMSGITGKSIIQHRLRHQVQLKATGNADPQTVHSVAAAGLTGASTRLPYQKQIQKSFGKHSVQEIRSYVGGPAAKANAMLGAEAYATGDSVAFQGSPSLHTAAHEAAHIIQQRAGVSLSGGVGQVGDRYEQHADAVADRVVQGKSAEDLLNGFGGVPSVQRKSSEPEEIQLKSSPQRFAAETQALISTMSVPEVPVAIASLGRFPVQFHPKHWDRTYSPEIDDVLSNLNPGHGFRTTLSKIKKAIADYSKLPSDDLETRQVKIGELHSLVTGWTAKHVKPEGMSKREEAAADLIAKITPKIAYELEDVALSFKRSSGEADPDKPSSWAQTKDFPTNSQYEITFRGLVGLKLGGGGVDPGRVGAMDPQDQKGFEEATPFAILNFADTGPNVSLTRSFGFAQGIVMGAKRGGATASNLLTVQVVRPEYGIDVEQNAENEIAADEGGALTEHNKAKAREAKEIATIRNPRSLILGWVVVPVSALKDPDSEAQFAFQRNPEFELDAPLEEMQNYDQFEALLAAYG